MSKAAKAAGQKAKKAGAEEKREDVLQAVVLADSFQDRFAPFSLERPRCLLPLANTPLIEYTLEYLAMNGVAEVFVYCGNHTDQVEQYIADSPRWSPSGRRSPFSLLEFVRVNDASSPGDFLRDLDGRGLISGDFILVHGDLVANIPLDAALTAHRRRREANRDAIMTMVLREGGESTAHRTKSQPVTPVFAIDAADGRCLHYEELSPGQADRYVRLDPAVLEHGTVELRADLIDCEIDICTPDVLALWSDSFDYESPRRNFLHGVLKDWELNGKLIHTEVVSQGYAARAASLRLYESVTRDVVGRWAFPMVPDNNLVHGQDYSLRAGFVYAEKGVKFEAGSHVDRSVVGMKSVVGPGSTVSNSVVGCRCYIGSNVVIEDSIIWSDATIEDGAVIKRSIVAGSVTIGRGCALPEGSLVSFGVHIGDGVSLPPKTTLSLLTHDRVLADPNKTLLGPSGKGAVYKYDDDDDQDDEEDVDELDPAVLQRSLIYSLEHLNISFSSISSFDSVFDEDDDEAGMGAAGPGGLSVPHGERHMSFSSVNSGGSGGEGVRSTFHTDAVTSLVEALRSEDASDLDAAKLEFMGLRLANDASDAQVRRAIATALVRTAVELMTLPAAPLEPSKAAERALKAKKGTAKFVAEVGVGEDQPAFALALHKAAAGSSVVEPARAGALLSALLQQLYAADVLEDDGIMAWWEASADAVTAASGPGGGERMAAVREKCQRLVEWLQEDDDDDDSDEDDD
ncbi:hypothetical protein RB597_001538 [Gaeumannomyces tritici]